MSGPSWNTSPARQVKHESVKIPSPPPSCLTTVTTLLRHGRPPSPAPSCSTTVLFGGRDRGQISIRPLSAILDPDDQMSTVSYTAPTSTRKMDVSTTQETVHSAVDEDINDWRSSIRNVNDRIKFIYENDDKYQDVTFEVEGSASKQQFKAHKLILRIASPVFDRIFAADTSNTIRVQIKDVEPTIFKILLRFIYTDEIDATDFDLLPLLQAAKIYSVRPLYLECVKSLKAGMSDNVAVKLCGIEASYADKLLLDAALDHIAYKAFEIFPSDDFLQIRKEYVCRLFTRNDLRIDEVTLFNAAVKWGEYNCIQQGIDITPTNLRRVLQHLIPEIRFPLMRPDEFTLLVIPTNLLSSEEQVGIYQYLCVDRAKQDKLPPISFKTTPRHSKKSIDLDSSSSSDYRDRDGSSASPEQVQSLPSIPNTDCLDLTTTEAESETASNVSTYSEKRKISRKYERSPSTSSGTSSKKRLKTENEKVRRKSVEKTARPKPFTYLFGDSTNKCIIVENVTISLNNFISDLSRYERRDHIESIKMTNVKIEDSRRLDGMKVNLPNLKQFELNIQIELEESTSFRKIVSETRFALEQYIFFDCKSSSWLYEKLWKTGIDVTVIINKVIVLCISHVNEHVTINRFNGAPMVLKSLRHQSVKSLVYSHANFTDKNFPSTLHQMVMHIGVSSHISGFIKQFNQLKDLTVVSPAASGENVRSLALDIEFLSKDKIRKLGLANFKLHLEATIRFYNLVALSLWRVNWDSYFEDKFHHTFPKLQELYLIGPGLVKGSPKLLKNILKIGSLTKFVCYACDFGLADADGIEMRKMLTDFGLSEPGKSFVLKKKSDSSGWEGSQITYKDSQNYIYKQFAYANLYEDFKTFFN